MVKALTFGRILLSLLLGYLFFHPSIIAQQNFTPIVEGDYEVIVDKTVPPSNITVNGYYKAAAMQKREGSFMGDKKLSETKQEISLSVRSVLNQHISVNGRLKNLHEDTEKQQTAHSTNSNNKENRSEDENGMDIKFEEAYLEYNHNPHAILRLGKQEIYVGDRQGLIYKDVTNAFTQDCRMGTWCTYVGGASLGDHERLYWMQLDYPVYQKGVIINDLWGKTAKRQQSSFNVEIFRISYSGKDAALGNYGGPTTDGSDYQQTTSSGDGVYYDIEETEYYGLNFDFNYYEFELDAHLITFSGKRVYHTGSQDSTTSVTEISDQNLNGSLFHLNPRYRISQNWKIEYDGLLASGTKKESKTERTWENSSSTYYEIEKGQFGNALIYFNGIEGLGEQHSVSNLTYHSIATSYRGSNQDRGFDVRFFDFKRTKAVYNTLDKQVTHIGQELDILFKWKLDHNLWIDIYWAMFQAGDAYSESDNNTPVDSPDDFNVLGTAVKYTF